MIPPLIGFFSKLFVLLSAVEAGNTFITLIAILVSVISCFYYLKIIRVLFTRSSFLDSLSLESDEKKAITSSQINSSVIIYENLFVNNLHGYTISVLTLIILLFIINPSILLNSTQLLTLTLFIN